MRKTWNLGSGFSTTRSPCKNEPPHSVPMLSISWHNDIADQKSEHLKNISISKVWKWLRCLPVHKVTIHLVQRQGELGWSGERLGCSGCSYHLFFCCSSVAAPRKFLKRNQNLSKVKKQTICFGSTCFEGWIFNNCAKVSSANQSGTLITASVLPSFPQYWKPNLVRSCLASDYIAALSYTAYFHPKCTFKTTRFALFSQLSGSCINPHTSNSLYCEMCWNKIKGWVQKTQSRKKICKGNIPPPRGSGTLTNDGMPKS